MNQSKEHLEEYIEISARFNSTFATLVTEGKK